MKIESVDDLWEKIKEYEGRVFYTAHNLRFSYTIRGGEMFISRKEKSITKSTVEIAYRNAEALGFAVKGPKKLKCFGASYLYPVFLEIGVIQREEDIGR